MNSDKSEPPVYLRNMMEKRFYKGLSFDDSKSIEIIVADDGKFLDASSIKINLDSTNKTIYG